MFIILPSDPTTLEASEYLKSCEITHRIISIPEELGYKTTANIGIYIEGSQYENILQDLSQKGFIIMRVFKSFEIC